MTHPAHSPDGRNPGVIRRIAVNAIGSFIGIVVASLVVRPRVDVRVYANADDSSVDLSDA